MFQSVLCLRLQSFQDHMASELSLCLSLLFFFSQFAGGFDAESMKAFEELRSRVGSQAGAAAAT